MQLMHKFYDILSNPPFLKPNYKIKFIIFISLIVLLSIIGMLFLFFTDNNQRIPIFISLVALIISLINTIMNLKPDSQALFVSTKHLIIKHSTSEAIDFYFYNPGNEQVLIKPINAKAIGSDRQELKINLSISDKKPLFLNPLTYNKCTVNVNFSNLEIDNFPAIIRLTYRSIYQINSYELNADIPLRKEE